MITRGELLDAIEACQEETTPNAMTCIKLASYLTIYDRLFRDTGSGYSGYSGAGESEFLRSAKGRDVNELMSIFDALMSTLMTVSPRLYDATMQKLR